MEAYRKLLCSSATQHRPPRCSFRYRVFSCGSRQDLAPNERCAEISKPWIWLMKIVVNTVNAGSGRDVGSQQHDRLAQHAHSDELTVTKATAAGGSAAPRRRMISGSIPLRYVKWKWFARWRSAPQPLSGLACVNLRSASRASRSPAAQPVAYLGSRQVTANTWRLVMCSLNSSSLVQCQFPLAGAASCNYVAVADPAPVRGVFPGVTGERPSLRHCQQTVVADGGRPTFAIVVAGDAAGTPMPSPMCHDVLKCGTLLPLPMVIS